MHTWHWRSWQESAYLQCSVLADWPHGFFTKQFAAQVPQDLVTVLHPPAQVYRVKQVHGHTVLTPTEMMPALSATYPAADGLVTDDVDQSVWVCSADCTPVLIADVGTGQVAAVHAGWRGTAEKIVPQAIATLQAQGSHLANLRVAMGPAIAGAVYQVTTEVAATVGATVVMSADPVAELAAQPDPAILPDPDPGRVRLDVRRVNALQLQHLGLSPEQIAIAPYCTYQHADHFFSYRRTQLKQVQWSGIVSRAIGTLGLSGEK